MRSTTPESTNLAASFTVRTRSIFVLWDEALDFHLLSSEDVEWKKVSEAMIPLGSKGMEDGVVGDAKVSPKEINQDFGVRHLGCAEAPRAGKDRCTKESCAACLQDPMEHERVDIRA
jgi:hypothetical protein